MRECGPETTEGKQKQQRFYGKYRGKVVSIGDPLFLGRIMAIVPSISQLIPTSWAMPCSPCAGLGVGMFYVPLIGSNVWIEFEEGDLDHPIWTGGFWDQKDILPIIPNPFLVPGVFTLSTLVGKITLSDATASVMIETKDQKKIILGPTGINIFSPGQPIDVTTTGVISIKTGAGSVTITTTGTVIS